jgi:hypothetical protein
MATTSESTANSTLTTATAEADAGREQEHGNGAAAAPAVVQQQDEDGDELIGPGPAPAQKRQKRPLQFEQAFLDALPSAAMCVSCPSFPFSAVGFGTRLCLLPGAVANCGGGCLLQVREELYAPGRRHPRRSLTRRLLHYRKR